jgi:hypothetical protein
MLGDQQGARSVLSMSDSCLQPEAGQAPQPLPNHRIITWACHKVLLYTDQHTYEVHIRGRTAEGAIVCGSSHMQGHALLLG